LPLARSANLGRPPDNPPLRTTEMPDGDRVHRPDPPAFEKSRLTGTRRAGASRYPRTRRRRTVVSMLGGHPILWTHSRLISCTTGQFCSMENRRQPCGLAQLAWRSRSTASARKSSSEHRRPSACRSAPISSATVRPRRWPSRIPHTSERLLQSWVMPAALRRTNTTYRLTRWQPAGAIWPRLLRGGGLP
jgi:hypothetical protein